VFALSEKTPMRQLATIASSDTAQTLADYLLTLHIDTKLEQQPEGWVVWVCDEDHLARARQELDEFTRNPVDPRYHSAPRVAENLRQRKLQEEEVYRRRQERFNQRMSGPIASERWTVVLIVVCVLLSLLSDGGNSTSPIVQTLSISPYRIIEDRIVYLGLHPILHGQIWRLATPIFLHFGVWHLLFDMYMLYFLGGAVEKRRGALRYLSLVLVLAVASNLVQYYFAGPNFGGMSGVVYGLFGYIWMKARFQPELGLHIQPNTVIYLIAGFFLCMTGLFGPIANWAHGGGLIAGILISYIPIIWRSSFSE
jgi:GlpG protein